MKNKLFLLALLTVSNISYGYRQVSDTEHITPIEKGAYEDLLRTIDEYNRLKGNNTNYLGNSHELKDSTKGIDIVAIGQFTNNGKYMEDLSKKKGFYRTDNYHTVADLIEKGASSLKEEGVLDKLSSVEVGDTKRFYFGNGNTVGDIKFTKADTFKEILKESDKNKNTKYHLTGSYMSIDSEKMNQLDISMDDYKNKLEGKSKKEVIEYLKEKLKSEKNIETVIKDNELYTKDDKGNYWKVLYNLEPVSVFQGKWADKQFEDTVFSKIFVYKTSSENGKSTGDILYTNNGNIYIEDKYDYLPNIRTDFSGDKNLGELIEDKENSTSQTIKDYYTDKKNLSEKEFKDKWITPFEKGGAFHTAYTNMNSELKKAKEEQVICEAEKNKTSAEVESIKKKLPSDFYNYTFGTAEEKKEYYNKQSAEVKKLIDKYNVAKELSDKASDKYFAILNAITTDIPKKYGFSNSWNATDDEKKWTGYLKLIVKDDSLISEVTTKNIEFRGNGRINGTVDLGEGYNKITITEQFSGQFGTNIILGPEAALKNVDIVYIGGGTGTTGSASISGKTSLALDIDKNIRNKEGHLIKHALANSDKDIIFSSSNSSNPDSRNNFSIEMMVSRLDKDDVINVGRTLEYEGRNPATNGNHDLSVPENLKYELNLISDSIAHELVPIKEKDKDGNSLMKVTLKDSIKMLDDNQNMVYKSLKDSGYLGSLHETLTTTNKKTIFSATDDESEELKEIKTAHYIRTKTPEELIKDLSQTTLNKEKEASIKTMITNLQNRTEIKDAQIAYKQLNEWKKSDVLKNSLSSLKNAGIDKALNDYKNYTEQEKKEKYKEIKELYNNKISELCNKVNSENQKLTSSKELSSALASLDSCFSSWKDESYLEESLKNADQVIKKIENLLNDNETSIDKELSKILKSLEYKTSDYTYDYKKLYSELFYTMRQEEALKELKTLLDQVYDKNIYSKVNKISKDEINIFNSIPFDITFDKTKTSYVNGGSISTRNAMDNFKGNIYSGYGVYETKLNENTNVGLIVGGGTSSHKEIKNDSLDKATTESKIKGTTAYFGGYNRFNFKNNYEWITGGGIQYGEYDVDRNFKNNYQSETFSGEGTTKSFNLYSGIIYNLNLKEDLSVKARGILSYTFINQGDITEENKPLSLNVKSQNYNYLDGEIGANITKTIMNTNSQSSISGGVSYNFALLSTDDDLTGSFYGSDKTFNINSFDYDQNSLKVFLDYNIYKDSGFNYGLEGSYKKNKEENNISIGIKAGYFF